MDELQLFSEKVRELIEQHSLHTVLDYGCGDGELLKRLEADTSNTVSLLGVDYFSRFPEDNRPRDTDRTTFIDKKSATFEKLITDQKCDLIVSTWAFHHFKLPLRELSTMYSLLKEGGFVFLVDFLFDSTSDARRVKDLFSFVDEAWLTFRGSFHRHHYTIEQAFDIFAASSLQVVSHEVVSCGPAEDESKEIADHFKDHLEQRISLIEKSDDPPLIKDYFSKRYAELRELIDTYGFEHGPFFMVFLRKV